MVVAYNPMLQEEEEPQHLMYLKQQQQQQQEEGLPWPRMLPKIVYRRKVLMVTCQKCLLELENLLAFLPPPIRALT